MLGAFVDGGGETNGDMVMPQASQPHSSGANGR